MRLVIASVPNTICFLLPQGSLFAASNFLVNARSGEDSSSFRIALDSREFCVRWTTTLEKPDCSVEGGSASERKQVGVATHGGDVVGQCVLGDKPQQIIGSTSLGAGTRTTVSAERINPNDSTNHIAIDVGIPD